MASQFYLTLLVGPTIPVPAPREVVQRPEKRPGHHQRRSAQRLPISLALSRTSLLNTTLLPAGYFDPGIRVIVIATVDAIPTVLMDGIVTRQEVAPSNEIGGSVLTVTGEDVSILMDLEENKEFRFPPPAGSGTGGAPHRQIRLSRDDPDHHSRGIPVRADPDPAIQSQQGATDLGYIQQQAKDVGYVFYVEPGPAPGVNLAYWGPEIRIGIPQPALNIDMDAHTNVESLSFSYDGLASKRVTVTIQEPITKISIPIPLPAFNPLIPPLALKPAPTLRTVPLQGAARLNPLEALGKGLAEAREGADAVSGSGQLDVLRYGRILKARGLVGVRGAGISYDGLYYVKSVTHTIKPGEYKQRFTLSRNGLLSTVPRVPA